VIVVEVAVVSLVVVEVVVVVVVVVAVVVVATARAQIAQRQTVQPSLEPVSGDTHGESIHLSVEPKSKKPAHDSSRLPAKQKPFGSPVNHFVYVIAEPACVFHKQSGRTSRRMSKNRWELHIPCISEFVASSPGVASDQASPSCVHAALASSNVRNESPRP
jgi:hypothetical protein